MSEPYKFGMAQNVVAVLHLDRELLEFIAYSISSNDMFAKDCWAALAEVDKFCGKTQGNRMCRRPADHELEADDYGCHLTTGGRQ